MFASALFTLALAVSALAVPTKRSGVVFKQCLVPNTVAITFDDGPHIYTRDLVDTLNAKNVIATFFVNGNNYGCIYDQQNVDMLKYAYESGHQISSHTWSHGHLPEMSWDQLHDQFWRVEEALMKIIGVSPGMMRPPFGEYNDLVVEVARARGQDVVVWDFDSGDSVGATPAQSIETYRTTTQNHPSTILTLNHETIPGTVYEVIPQAIDMLQGAGYKLVSVAECLGLPTAYQWTAEPTPRDETWHC